MQVPPHTDLAPLQAFQEGGDDHFLIPFALTQLGRGHRLHRLHRLTEKKHASRPEEKSNTATVLTPQARPLVSTRQTYTHPKYAWKGRAAARGGKRA
jgi:hypothetical protein